MGKKNRYSYKNKLRFTQLIHDIKSFQEPLYDKSYQEHFFVVIPGKELNLSSEVYLMDDDDLDLSPNIDTDNYVIDMDVVIDVLGNLYLQKSKYTDQEALKAIKFYIKNDAFININGNSLNL